MHVYNPHAIFKGEDGNDSMSRNASTELPLKNARRAQIACNRLAYQAVVTYLASIYE